MKKTLLLLIGIISIFAITACKKNESKETIPRNPVAKSSADEVKNAILATYSLAGHTVEANDTWQKTGNEEIKITEVVEGDTIKLVIETKTTGNTSGNIVSRSIMANKSNNTGKFTKVIITFYANGRIEKQEFTKDSEDDDYGQGEIKEFKKESINELKNSVVEAVVPQEIKNKADEDILKIKNIMMTSFINNLINSYSKNEETIEFTNDKIELRDEDGHMIIEFYKTANELIFNANFESDYSHWYGVSSEQKQYGNDIIKLLTENGYKKIDYKEKGKCIFKVSIKPDGKIELENYYEEEKWNSLTNKWVISEKEIYKYLINDINEFEEFWKKSEIKEKELKNKINEIELSNIEIIDSNDNGIELKHKHFSHINIYYEIDKWELSFNNYETKKITENKIIEFLKEIDKLDETNFFDESITISEKYGLTKRNYEREFNLINEEKGIYVNLMTTTYEKNDEEYYIGFTFYLGETDNAPRKSFDYIIHKENLKDQIKEFLKNPTFSNDYN